MRTAGLLLTTLLAACATTPPPPLVPGAPLAWPREDAAVLRGPVLVDVWASWCVRCAPVMASHARAVAETDGRVRHVAWNVDEGTEHLASVLAAVQPQPSARIDAGGRRLAPLLAVTRLPTTLLLDAEGRLVLRHDGTEVPGLAARLIEVAGPNR